MVQVVQLRDRSTGGEIAVTFDRIDLYEFFIQVQIHQIKSGIDSGQLSPIAQNWQFGSGEDAKNVIGSSNTKTHVLFYVETEEQTRARITHL